MHRGLLVVATMAVLTGCNQPPPSGAAEASDDTGDTGRFVIVHSPQVERDTILLDTETGRTWQQVTVSDAANEPTVWVPIPEMNGPKDWSALYAQHPAKPAPTETPVEGNPFAGAASNSN
jgi:hypothetical protein